MTVTYKEPSYLSWLGFGKKHDIEVSLNMDQAEKLEKYRDLKELSKV